MSELVDHALALAAHGFAVFPLQARSKEPYPKTRGLLDASRDADQICRWWEIAPESNIGLRPDDGVMVIDVDPRNDGHATLTKLERQHGPLPDTLVARTGGDGLHAFYLVPEGLSWPKELAPGIDLKGHRGYVLAAPSVHPDTGKLYEWLTPLGTPIAPAPAWVIAKGYVPDERVTVIDEDQGELLPEAEVERFAAELGPLFESGKKHAIAYALGGWLRQRGWNSADVVRVVEALPSKNVRARVKDALDGYKANQGWHGLRTALGEAAASQLDQSAPNPRRARELEERAAAAALIPAMAASAVQAPVFQPGLNQAPGPVGQVEYFTQAQPTPHVFDAPDDMIARLRRLQNQGPKHPTGLPPLDKALRGGFMLEKVLIVGGAPGAGKTALLRQVGDFMCRNGVAIGWMASDEEPSAIDGRRLQAIGIPREVAEQPDEAALERAARELSPLPFVVYDVSEGWTVEKVFGDMARRYPNMPRAIFGDSVQTVRTDRTANIDSERKQIDDVMMTAKALARSPATRAMVAFTSELGRGAYRSELSAETTSDLAAFKESGGIEYYGHILIVLRSVKGEGAYIDATMPKNRLGPKVDFLLKIDFETTNLTESYDDPRRAQMKAAAELVIPEVVKALEQCGWPGLTGRGVEAAVPRDTKVVRYTLQVMRERGLVKSEMGPRNAIFWRLANATPQGQSHAPPSTVPAPEPSLNQSMDDMAAALRPAAVPVIPEAAV